MNGCREHSNPNSNTDSGFWRKTGYLASLLVARLGETDAARGVIDAASASQYATPLLHNAMLRGYLSLGLPREAAALLRAMLASGSCAPDPYTYHLAATVCARAPRTSA
jgi:pentatricopeptide repeat protein